MQSRLTRRIPVEEKTWAELSRLKKPGETFDDLLNRLMEHEAGIRLFRDLRKLEQDEAFHEFSWEIRLCSGSKFTRSWVVPSSMKTIDLPWEIMQEDVQESENIPGPDSQKKYPNPPLLLHNRIQDISWRKGDGCESRIDIPQRICLDLL